MSLPLPGWRILEFPPSFQPFHTGSDAPGHSDTNLRWRRRAGQAQSAPEAGAARRKTGRQGRRRAPPKNALRATINYQSHRRRGVHTPRALAAPTLCIGTDTLPSKTQVRWSPSLPSHEGAGVTTTVSLVTTVPTALHATGWTHPTSHVLEGAGAWRKLMFSFPVRKPCRAGSLRYREPEAETDRGGRRVVRSCQPAECASRPAPGQREFPEFPHMTERRNVYFPWKFQWKVKGPLVEIRWWKWTPLELEMCV